MKDVAGERGQARSAPARAPQTPLTAPGNRSPATQALALQRLVGNRIASRVLSRWIKHPDPEKKGVMVPDVVASEFTRFNPPKNE